MSHVRMDQDHTEKQAFGRVRYGHSPEHLVMSAPSPRNTAWRLAAVLYGVPWLLTVIAVSVWYLGWGVPPNPLVRVLIWLVTMLLTFALHTVALLSIWGAFYSRDGLEEIVIDDERISVVRHAGKVPIRIHIKRSISEHVHLLPQHHGKLARPRVEVRALRSAIRFGAGMTSEEAEACVEALNRHFERAEQARDAR